MSNMPEAAIKIAAGCLASGWRDLEASGSQNSIASGRCILTTATISPSASFCLAPLLAPLFWGFITYFLSYLKIRCMRRPCATSTWICFEVFNLQITMQKQNPVTKVLATGGCPKFWFCYKITSQPCGQDQVTLLYCAWKRNI